MKALTITLCTFISSSSSKDKTIDKNILKKLMRDMRELKIEMNNLKKYTRSYIL